MEVSDILIPAIIGLIVWAIILSNIITSASHAKKIELQLKMQTLLLAKMAQKQGVSDKEVNTILNIE